MDGNVSRHGELSLGESHGVSLPACSVNFPLGSGPPCQVCVRVVTFGERLGKLVFVDLPRSGAHQDGIHHPEFSLNGCNYRHLARICILPSFANITF